VPEGAALGLLIAALPPALWAALSDLRALRIPNAAVLWLAGGYAAIGLLLLPLDGWSLSDWAWRWTHLLVILALGVALNAARLVGAGDAKFAAAAAPYVALPDARLLLLILAAASLLSVALHRLARRGIGPSLAPRWESWTSGRRFPMGVPLAAALLAYLALRAAG
jgi:prepilin peptidase CpaA